MMYIWNAMTYCDDAMDSKLRIFSWFFETAQAHNVRETESQAAKISISHILHITSFWNFSDPDYQRKEGSNFISLLLPNYKSLESLRGKRGASAWKLWHNFFWLTQVGLLKIKISLLGVCDNISSTHFEFEAHLC